MNATALTFTLLSTLALLVLPRRWAPLPLLAGACYMTAGQRIDVGPFTFTVLRILLAAAFTRIILRRESLAGRWNRLDSLIVAWGIWAAVSSVFHEDVSSSLVNHLGTVYNTWGIYFLLRIFCSSLDDVVRLCRTTAIVLVPVALEMVYEQAAFHNLFSMFGGVPDTPQLRDGRIRAFGPFGHPILAGSVGGVTLPLMIGIWKYHRASACVGILVCVTMVIASASSGPAMSASVGITAICLWRSRRYTRLFRWMLLGAYTALELVMERPAYFIIQRLEVVGGSTGWYRSRLIETALEHLNEWWLAGTDVTRHWMFANANDINANHIDITNFYLALGVMGGLPLLLLHIAILTTAFSYVGQGFADSAGGPAPRRFMLWTLGCALLAHAVTSISVSYFDQSFIFLYLTLAAVGSAHAAKQPHSVRDTVRAVNRSTPELHTRHNWRRMPVQSPRH